MQAQAETIIAKQTITNEMSFKIIIKTQIIVKFLFSNKIKIV